MVFDCVLWLAYLLDCSSYSLYVLGIAAFFVGLHYATNWLDGWLTDYEAAQPDVKCRAVFAQLFEKPDWEALYTQAGCSDTEYESAKLKPFTPRQAAATRNTNPPSTMPPT